MTTCQQSKSGLSILFLQARIKLMVIDKEEELIPRDGQQNV